MKKNRKNVFRIEKNITFAAPNVRRENKGFF
jgi:hypothetical protein